MYKQCPRCKTKALDMSQALCPKCRASLVVELDEGDAVGVFTIGAKLPEGDGGMAAVHKAKMQSRRGLVALKIAHDKPYEYAALQKEAEVLRELDHPNIVKIVPLPAGQHGQGLFVEKTYIGGEPKCYIALEYIDGYSLRRRLKHPKPLTTAEIVTIVRQVGSALSYAHSKGVVHLDIKPSNILLTKDGRKVVLTDFGIVRLTDDRRGDRSWRLVGTAGYMSPEHATRGTVDHRSDIFSLGVVLYEMLTGESPFRSETTSQTLSAVIHRDPPSPSELNPSLSAEVDKVVQKALAKDKRDRFQTTREMVEALEKAIPLPAVSLPPTFVGAAGAIGLILGLAGLLFAMWPRDGVSTPAHTPTRSPVVIETATATVGPSNTATAISTITATAPRPTATSTMTHIPTSTLQPTPSPRPTLTRTSTPVVLTPSTPELALTGMRLGTSIGFLGYELDTSAVQAGQTLLLTLRWQAVSKVDRSYTVFAHLIDDRNRIWGQQDSVPCGGGCPTNTWAVGKVFEDKYEIRVQDNAPSGEYMIEIGMYDAGTMKRLPMLDEAGVEQGDRILLDGKIRVTARPAPPNEESTGGQVEPPPRTKPPPQPTSTPLPPTLLLPSTSYPYP